MSPINPAQRARILVVDDDRDIASYLAAVLTLDGYEAIEANQAENAIEIIRDNPPDLVLTDLMMPGVGGIGLLTYLKHNHDLPFIPVIMVTALQDNMNKAAALEAGCDDFLTKPVNNSELKARVRSLLRLKRTNDILSSKLSEHERAEARAELYQSESGNSSAAAMTKHQLESLLNDVQGKVQAALSSKGSLANHDLVEVSNELQQAIAALHKL